MSGSLSGEMGQTRLIGVSEIYDTEVHALASAHKEMPRCLLLLLFFSSSSLLLLSTTARPTADFCLPGQTH